MKLANVAGRAALVLDDGVADLAEVSDGRFGPDLMDAYARWDEVRDLATSATAPTASTPA